MYFQFCDYKVFPFKISKRENKCRIITIHSLTKHILSYLILSLNIQYVNNCISQIKRFYVKNYSNCHCLKKYYNEAIYF